MMVGMTPQHDLIVIFGRLPRLAFQELAAVAPVFGVTTSPTWLEHESAILSRAAAWSDEELAQLQRILGGTVRIAERVTTCSAQELARTAAQLVGKRVPAEGKITVGISSWADTGKPKPPVSLARQVKHALSVAGRSVRTVVPPAPRTHLSAPQVIHNKLVGSPKAVDLACFWIKGSWILGVTRAVQDIADYTKRDFGIPKPDAVSGMLPPKLAQTMINLAVGANRAAAVYDPFCGNGRVVLEALLLGLPAYGSDVEEGKVAATQTNCDWLVAEYQLTKAKTGSWVQDARQTSAVNKVNAEIQQRPWYIVTEPYLGRPLRQRLDPSSGAKWASELQPIYGEFLTVWSQARLEDRPEAILMVFPRVKLMSGGTVGVLETLVDRLEGMGYSAEVLFCYDRPDSIVQRDLVRITYR